MAEYEDGRGKHFTRWFVGLLLGIPLLCGGCGVLGFFGIWGFSMLKVVARDGTEVNLVRY